MLPVVTTYTPGHGSKYHFHTIPPGASRSYVSHDPKNIANCAYAWAKTNKGKVRTKIIDDTVTIWRLS